MFLQFSNNNGVTPGSQYLSHVRDISVFSMGAIGFVVFFCILVFAWSNAVNFTDGLDGLAAGSMGMILGPTSSSPAGSTGTRVSSSPPPDATTFVTLSI